MNDAIDSTFVSSVGKYVNRFEKMMCDITGALFAVATVNGTCCPACCLKLVGVDTGNEVIIPPLTFVATANAITLLRGRASLPGRGENTLGLNPDAVAEFLGGTLYQGKWMDFATIGTPEDVLCVVFPYTSLATLAVSMRLSNFAEHMISLLLKMQQNRLGSLYLARHTGTFGKMGIYSFNGNKTMTCGGGGVIVTNDNSLPSVRNI